MASDIPQKYQPINGRSVDSFAHFTILERLPMIIDRLIDDHTYNKKVISQLYLLKENLLHGKLEYFPTSGNGADEWKEYLTPYLGLSWFEAPFYFIEVYFYRMILDAVNFFENGVDPFQVQKKLDIKTNLEGMENLITVVDEFNSESPNVSLEKLLQLSLWGNKVDLSQLQIDRNAHSNDLTLIDHTEMVSEIFQSGISSIDIILDNAGMELFADLVLSTRLLQLKLVNLVILHAKSFPTFVSDATEEDVDVLIKYLQLSDHPSIKDLIHYYKKYIETGQIKVVSNDYWNSPLHFYQMQQELHKDLAKSDLIIFKGDANYRRIFGDRLIPIDASLPDLIDYLPSKSLAIRILKSEILCGFNNEQANLISQSEPDWLYSGKYGVIQVLN